MDAHGARAGCYDGLINISRVFVLLVLVVDYFPIHGRAALAAGMGEMSSPSPRDVRDGVDGSPGGEPNDTVTSPTQSESPAAKLVRAASLSPSASPRVSLDVVGRDAGEPHPRDFFLRYDLGEDRCDGDNKDNDTAEHVESTSSAGGRPPLPPKDDEKSSSGFRDEYQDPDVSTEVSLLVKAACHRGLGAAAMTLREAMSIAGETSEITGGGPDTARAMATALANALCPKILPFDERNNLEEESTQCSTSYDKGFDDDDPGDNNPMDLPYPSSVANPKALLLAAQLLEAMPADALIVSAPADSENKTNDTVRPDTHSTQTVYTKPGPRERILRAICRAFRANVSNCAEASKAGAFPYLAKFLARVAKEEGRNKGTSDGHSGNTETSMCVTLASSCVAHLAAYSVSANDLKSWLNLCSGAEGKDRGVLLNTLAKSLKNQKAKSPASVFSLDGEQSGLLGCAGGGDILVMEPPVGMRSLTKLAKNLGMGKQSEWLFSKGFAIVTWVYLESLRPSDSNNDMVKNTAAMAQISVTGTNAHRASPAAAAVMAAAAAGETEEHMPRLFSFISSDSGSSKKQHKTLDSTKTSAQGIEAYFHGSYLVLEAIGVGGDKISAPFTYPFQLKKWQSIGVEYTPPDSKNKSNKNGFLSLFVDGVLVETQTLKIPQINGTLGFCCIGTNPPAAMSGLQRKRRQCALFGRLGPVYVFKENLGLRLMKKVMKRGGSYVPQYGGGIGGGIAGTDGGDTAGTTDTVDNITTGVNNTTGDDIIDASATSNKDASLDSELGLKLLQLLHPASVPCADDGDDKNDKNDNDSTQQTQRNSRKVHDLSPNGFGGRKERAGSLIGNTIVVRTGNSFSRPIRDALRLVHPNSVAELLQMMCPEVCVETKQPVCPITTSDNTFGSNGSAGKIIAAASAITPVLEIMALLLEGEESKVTDIAHSMERADVPTLLAHVLPASLQAIKEVCDESDADKLDKQECAVVDLVERLVENAPRGSALRDGLVKSLFLSFDPWTGGSCVDVNEQSLSRNSSHTGVGAAAMGKVLNVVNSLAHVDGGCVLLKHGGPYRLLDAGKRRVRVRFTGTETNYACDENDGCGTRGDILPAKTLQNTSTVPLTLRCGVENAPRRPQSVEISFGVRVPRGDDCETVRSQLLDLLVIPIRALLVSGEQLVSVLAYLGDCDGPTLAAKVLTCMVDVSESPGAQSFHFRNQFREAGGIEVALGLLRAAALRCEESSGTSRVNDIHSENGVVELVTSCFSVLLCFARRRELATGVSSGGVDGTLVERAARFAFTAAPNLLAPRIFKICHVAAVDTDCDTIGILGAALEALPHASPETRRRALTDVDHSQLTFLPEWPAWLAECLTREESIVRSDTALDKEKNYARETAGLCFAVLEAQWRDAVTRDGGWRIVETAIRAFHDTSSLSHDSAIQRDSVAVLLAGHASYVADAIRNSDKKREKDDVESSHRIQSERRRRVGSVGAELEFNGHATDMSSRVYQHAEALVHIIAGELSRDAETSAVYNEKVSPNRLGLLRASCDLLEALFADDARITATCTATTRAALFIALCTVRAEESEIGDRDEDDNAPLTSAATAEAATSSDGAGPGGVSTGDSLKYQFTGNTGCVGNWRHFQHALSTTHRVMSPFLRSGRNSMRGAVPFFALHQLFREMQNESTGSKSARFLTTYLLCLTGRYRALLAEACADGDGHGSLVSAAAASELLSTGESTKALLLRGAKQATQSVLQSPWADIFNSKVVENVELQVDSMDSNNITPYSEWSDSSIAARLAAERSSQQARCDAFSVFAKAWRELGQPIDASAASADISAETELPQRTKLQLTLLTARWRELLELASKRRTELLDEEKK